MGGGGSSFIPEYLSSQASVHTQQHLASAATGLSSDVPCLFQIDLQQSVAGTADSQNVICRPTTATENRPFPFCVQNSETSIHY